MLSFSGQPQTYCDGVSRRGFLRVGSLGLSGLTLADLLRSDARANATMRPKSVVYVVLGGGPSHIDIKLPDFNGRPQHLLEDRTPIR